MKLSKKDVITTTTFRHLLIIQVLSNITGLVGPFIDGIVISNFLGSVSMAAFGIATPIPIVLAAISGIFNSGSQALAGRYMGRGQVKELNSLMTLVVLGTTAIGALLTLIMVCFPASVAALLGAQGEIVADCADYVRSLAFGVIPILLTPVLVGFLQIDQDGKRAVTGALIMSIANAALDILTAVLHLGMFGMGLATAISQAIAVGYMLLHFTKKNSKLKFIPKGMQFSKLTVILATGLPSAVYHFCNVLRIGALNRLLVNRCDTKTVAAFSVQNSLTPIIMGCIIGTGVTTLLVCSVIAGEENRRSLRKTLAYILKLGVSIAFGLAVFVFAFAKVPLAMMFCGSSDPELLALVTRVLRFFSVSIPFTMLNMILIFYYQSMQKNGLSNFICIFDNAVFLIASAYLLSDLIGSDGVWVSFLIAEVMILIVLAFIVGFKQHKIPTSLHDFMLLPDDFGVDVDHRMNITATSLDEVTTISEDIINFCEKQGIDSRRSMAAGLCMEEFAAAALADDGSARKLPYVDIYLTYKNGELKIRLRDNGVPFDTAKLNPDNTSDIGDAASMRIVTSLAKDVSYSSVLGLNVFSLVL